MEPAALPKPFPTWTAAGTFRWKRLPPWGRIAVTPVRTASPSIRTIPVSGVPVKFVGVGERLEDLTAFEPERMAGRILGMGDVVSLVEKAQEVIDEKEAEKAARKMQRGRFNFEDFLSQLEMLSKMGPLNKLLEMLPGYEEPRHMVYADFYPTNNGDFESSQWANRLDLFANYYLTPTERFFVGVRPLEWTLKCLGDLGLHVFGECI